MITNYPQLNIHGECFSPRKASEAIGLKWHESNEPGDIGEKGRFKGRAKPYGAASYIASEDIPSGERLTALLSQLEGTIDTLIECGADTIILHIDVEYIGQCNLEFTPEEIKRISDMGVPLTITCWEETS